MKVSPNAYQGACQAELPTIAFSAFFVTGGTLLIALVIISATPLGPTLFGVNALGSSIALGVSGVILVLAGIGGCMQNGMPLEMCRDFR